MAFFSDLTNSLNNRPGGYSARKVFGFIGLLVGIYITVKHSTAENSGTLLTIWICYSSYCIGLITFSQLQQIRTGQVDVQQTQITQTQITETK